MGDFLFVRHQRQLDRMHDLNNGGFLPHRRRVENADEIEDWCGRQDSNRHFLTENGF